MIKYWIIRIITYQKLTGDDQLQRFYTTNIKENPLYLFTSLKTVIFLSWKSTTRSLRAKVKSDWVKQIMITGLILELI